MHVETASELLEINKNTAKTIIHTYRTLGRILKKKTRMRKSKFTKTKSSKRLAKQPSAIMVEERQESGKIEEIIPTQFERTSEECTNIKFSFKIYKETIELGYKRCAKIAEEEKMEECITLPSPFEVEH